MSVNRIILLIFIALIPFNMRLKPLTIIPYVGDRICLLELLFPILLVLFFINQVIINKNKVHIDSIIGAWFVLTVASVVSGLFSSYTITSMVESTKYIYYLLMMVIIYNILLDDPRNILFSIRSFLVIGFIVLLIGFSGWIVGKITGEPNFAVRMHIASTAYHVEYIIKFFGANLKSSFSRINSIFFHPNGFLPYLSFCIFIGFATIILDRNKFFYKLSIITIIIGVIILFTSLYRNAFLAWGVLFFGVLLFPDNLGIKTIRLISFVLFVGLLLLGFAQTYFTIMPIKISNNATDKVIEISFSSEMFPRYKLQEVAFSIFTNNPYLGSGPGTYEEEMVKPFYGIDFNKNPAMKAVPPHSAHFNVLSEMGAFGYAAFLLFYVVVINKCRRITKYKNKYYPIGKLFLPFMILIIASGFVVNIVNLRFMYFAFALLSAIYDLSKSCFDKKSAF